VQNVELALNLQEEETKLHELLEIMENIGGVNSETGRTGLDLRMHRMLSLSQ
jgi:hypothetical protein